MWITDPRKIKGYFQSYFTVTESSNGWNNFNCPFCGDDKSKMAVHYHYSYTKCWICGYRNHVIQFISDFENISIRSSKDKLQAAGSLKVQPMKVEGYRQEVSISPPKGYKSISEGGGLIANRARKYLKGRGFNIDILDNMGFGYCDDKNSEYFARIIIPFKSYGKLVYYIGRDILGGGFRYLNPSKKEVGIGKGDVLFNSDALDIFDKVYITEGWADALTMGTNGLSTQGWSLSSRQAKRILTSTCDELVFIPDAGADGSNESFYTKALYTSLKFLRHKKIKILNLNVFSEGKDVNELGSEKVINLYESTDYTTFEIIIKEIVK